MSEISVVVVGSTSISSVVGNGDTVNVNVGNQTIGGGNGAAATIEVGTVTTVDATQTATITNVGTAYAAKFNFSLPRGLTGATGPANSLSIGSVSTGTTAAVSISGNAPSQSLSFVLQPGPAGPANSLSIGSVSTGTTAAVSISGNAPSQSLSFVLPQGPAGPVTSLAIGSVAAGTAAAATITGTAPTQTLNLVLPRGDTGIQGVQGDVGPSGPANSLSIASVSTGTTAAVTISGAAPSQTLSFVLPVGPQGPQGQVGPAGPPANLADETPQPLGTASAGTALTAARADHVHAVGSIAYSSLSGIPATFAPSPHSHEVSDVTGLQAALDGKQAAGTYATLVNNLVPSANLPSFVDDVVDVGGTLPATGDVGKIYVVSTGANTNKIYRWSGSAFIEISPSPGSTDSVTEGSVNLYHTTNRAAAAAPVQSVSGRTGVITVAQLGTSGTASSTTFLRGDGAWAAAGSTDAGDLVTGILAPGRLPLATTTAAGAVIVGSGLTISSGVLSATGGGGSFSGTVDGGTYTGTIVYDNTITITQQPTNQTAVGGAATLRVVAVSSPGGRVRYQWQRQIAGTWTAVAGGTSTALALTGLTNAVDNAALYRVVLSSQSAASVTSSEVMLGVDPLVPGAPTNVAGYSGDSFIRATWDAPASNGGSPITDYVIQYQPFDGSSWTTYNDGTSTGTQIFIQGIAVGYYYLRVAAVNAIGQGPWSATFGPVNNAPSPLAGSSTTGASLGASWSGTGQQGNDLSLPTTYFSSSSGGPAARITARYSGRINFSWSSTGSNGRSVSVFRSDMAGLDNRKSGSNFVDVSSNEGVIIEFYPADPADRISISAYLVQ